MDGPSSSEARKFPEGRILKASKSYPLGTAASFAASSTDATARFPFKAISSGSSLLLGNPVVNTVADSSEAIESISSTFRVPPSTFNFTSLWW